jgi:hypothetical protein
MVFVFAFCALFLCEIVLLFFGFVLVICSFFSFFFFFFFFIIFLALINFKNLIPREFNIFCFSYQNLDMILHRTFLPS